MHWSCARYVGSILVGYRQNVEWRGKKGQLMLSSNQRLEFVQNVCIVRSVRYVGESLKNQINKNKME